MNSKLIINVGKVCLCRAMHGEKVNISEVAEKYSVTEEHLIDIINDFKNSIWFYNAHKYHGHKGCPLEFKI